MDWEDWLRKAAAPPSQTEDDKRETTEKEIKDALASYAPLKGKPYRVYAKGSYANNTNVRLNYDVDIAVEYYGYFYYDLDFAVKGEPKETVGIVASDDPYTRDDFKADILGAVQAAYGASAIKTGRIAYRVREKKTTLPADVVPSWEYRRYDAIDVCHLGSCVFPSDGHRKVNYPERQKTRNNTKNDYFHTSRRYKRMVRALKKLQTRLIDAGELKDEIASYHVECLVYNVPDNCFNRSSYLADMRAILATIFNETLESGGWNDWEEVNGLTYLFRGPDSPTRVQAHALASAAWDHIGFQ